eukprot:gene17709-19478_t
MNNAFAGKTESLDAFKPRPKESDIPGGKLIAENVKKKPSRWDVRLKETGSKEDCNSTTQAQLLIDTTEKLAPITRNREMHVEEDRLVNMMFDEIRPLASDPVVERHLSTNLKETEQPSEEELSENANPIVEEGSTGEEDELSDVIVDREVRNIINKNITELREDKRGEPKQDARPDSMIGYLSSGDNMSMDLETSTLSPCFPLIRDKDKPAVEIATVVKQEQMQTSPKSDALCMDVEEDFETGTVNMPEADDDDDIEKEEMSVQEALDKEDRTMDVPEFVQDATVEDMFHAIEPVPNETENIDDDGNNHDDVDMDLDTEKEEVDDEEDENETEVLPEADVPNNELVKVRQCNIDESCENNDNFVEEKEEVHTGEATATNGRDNYSSSEGGVNIVSSSIDSKSIDEFKESDLDKESPKISSERTSGRQTEIVNAEINTNLSSSSVDTSTELLGDVSFQSSIDDEDETEPPQYDIASDNVYLINKKKSRMHKEVRRMKCDCTYEPDESGFVGCGAGCMNRLLMIECGSKCNCGEFCTNKNFQRGCRYNLEVFKAGKKGWGLKAQEKIEEGSFVIEYCGEVVNYAEFMKRTETYDQEGRKHYYFMTLKANEIIDATRSGNISRFINHSCDPNCVTQKWTVNGFLRVGFFSLREIQPGEELSFDYQYQRYGEKAQRCLCGSSNCRGVIGELKKVPLKNTPASCDSPKRKAKKKNISEYTTGFTFDEEITAILGDEQKIELTDTKALKAFIRYNGLSLLWSWMVESPCDASFKLQILNLLKLLPIPSKNHLDESKLLPLVEKLSDPQEAGSTRSDEDGSSNSDNDKEESTPCSSEKVEETVKITERKDSKDSDGVDEDSDGSEKNEEIISLASELLDRWKMLREVFKIPKKIPLTPDQSKNSSGSEASASTADDSKRNSKRKFDVDSATVYSPKRQFNPLVSLSNNSPIRPLMESPTHSHLRDSPSRSPHSTKTMSESEQSEDAELNTFGRLTPKKERSEEFGDSSRRKNDSRLSSEDYGDSKFTRIRGRFARGGPPWRSSGTQHQDSPRGGRGTRGRARNRMWGQGGRYQHNNDMNTVQKSPGVQEFNQTGQQPGSYRGRNFPMSATSQATGSSYSYHHVTGQDVFQNRPTDFQSGMKNMESRLRNPGYDTQYGRQTQDWQTQAMTNQGYNAPRMSSNLNQQPPVAPPQQYVGMQMINQPAQNAQMQNFQQSWSMNPPGQGIVAANMRTGQNIDAQGVMNGTQPMPIANQPYTYQQQNAQIQSQHQQPDMVQQSRVTAIDTTDQMQHPVNQQQRPCVAVNAYTSRSPEVLGDSLNMNLGTPTRDHWRSDLGQSPANSKSFASLPPGWKTATDPEGKIYYYHVITRRTQWDMPTCEDESPARPLNMSQKNSIGLGSGPRTPPASPPHSSISPARYGTTTRPLAISDPAVSTTRMSNIPASSAELTPKQQKIRDNFKMKLSGVVVNCLNPYQKVDCKHARIAKIEDFKFLARKLTHGLLMKELARNRPDEELECNDSVKIKVKEYIRNYMKKYVPAQRLRIRCEAPGTKLSARTPANEIVLNHVASNEEDERVLASSFSSCLKRSTTIYYFLED